MILSSKIRRRAGLAAIGLATVAATTVPASALFAATSSKSPAPSHHAVRRIHLVEREIATPHLDLGKPGPSMGDRGTITSDMLDRHGKVVGRADADCGLTAVGRRMGGLCSIVVTLPGGQITGTFFESFGPGAGEEGVASGRPSPAAPAAMRARAASSSSARRRRPPRRSRSSSSPRTDAVVSETAVPGTAVSSWSSGRCTHALPYPPAHTFVMGCGAGPVRRQCPDRPIISTLC